MNVLENFKNLFLDVWKEGVSGIYINGIVVNQVSQNLVEGTFLETISSNFKSFYKVQIAEKIKEFKAKEFETHSIIYSKINDKYYYVFNMPNDYLNLIVKIDDELITESEFIEIIINRFGEDSIINNDGNTLGDLYEKVS